MSTERIELKPRILVDRRLAQLFGIWLPLTLVGFGGAVLAILLWGDTSGIASDDPWLVPATWIAAPGLILAGIYLGYAFRLMRNARLIIDDTGMTRPNDWAPPWMRMVVRPWSIRWDEITAVNWWTPGHGQPSPVAMNLVLHRRRGWRVILPPMQWVPVNVTTTTRSAVPLFARLEETREQLADNAVVRAIRHYRPDLGLLDDEDAFADQVRPALGQRGVTPTTAIIAALSVAALVYFIADMYFLATEFYAGARPWAAYAGFGVLAAAVAGLALKRAEPGRSDSWGYALLFGVMAGIAAYPGLLRVNAWLSEPQSVRAVDYRLDEDHLWQPVSLGSAPALDLYIERSRWWRRFEPGDTYRFRLRDGALGFWQVDLAPVYADQRRFYREHAPPAPGSGR